MSPLDPHSLPRGAPETPEIEPDRPPTARIAIIVILLFLAFVVAILGVAHYATHVTNDMMTEMDGATVDPRLIEVRKMDEKSLAEYDRLDAEKGIYQIPIQKAMELLIRQPERYIQPLPAIQPALQPTDPGGVAPVDANPSTNSPPALPVQAAPAITPPAPQ